MLLSAVAMMALAGPVYPDVFVAAYYYPGFHEDPRWNAAKYKGFTEWDLIKAAKPRFPGHRQPKVPLWGYEDESKPTVMAKKIAAAADHGIDAFLFDWYDYDGPFLDDALDKGFLKAKNSQRIKFALMWANHDWYDIQGYDPKDPVKMLFSGKVNDKSWDRITDKIVGSYFTKKNYWRIEGKPYFSIYDIGNFLESFGSVDGARAALDLFRKKAGGVHVNVEYYGQPNLPGMTTPYDWKKLCSDLNVDSTTGYTWAHYGLLNYETFPVSDYVQGRDNYLGVIDSMKDFPVPYFPNTTVHWDNSPRAAPDADWSHAAAHVVNPVVQGNSPAEFEKATRMIVDRLLASNVQPKVLTVNAWNEWPEGSVLEPEKQYGYGYLDVMKKLFK